MDAKIKARGILCYVKSNQAIRRIIMMSISVLIPSRSEPYLQKTIEDIFEHSEADTEVIVGMDGCYEVLKGFGKNSPKLHWTYTDKARGQRATTNELARIARRQKLLKKNVPLSFF